MSDVTDINKDIDFDDFDDFQKELDKDLAELEALSALVVEGFVWWAILEEVVAHTEEFIGRSAQLKKGVLITFAKKDEDFSFLVGNLISGILSLYEGFVHNVLDSCLNKNSYMEHALGNLHKLSKKNKRRLRFQKDEDINVDVLRAALQKSTLNEPEIIRNLALELFDLSLPAPSSEVYKKIISIRNAYTHNGGKLDGQQLKLTGKDFLIVQKLFDNLISNYANHITNLANSFMDDND